MGLVALQDEVVLYDREVEVPTGERANPTRRVRDRCVVRLADFDAAWEGEGGSLCLRGHAGHADTSRRGLVHELVGEHAAKVKASIDPASLLPGPPPKPSAGG